MGLARRLSWAWVAVTAVIVAVAVGCGDDDASGGGPAPGASGDRAADARGAQGPERIVSLSPTATETLFAIGAGPQVVAVDEQSDHPPEAPRTDLSGQEPSVEAVVELRPDLVILSELVPRDVVDGLRRVGVRVFTPPAAETLADAYRQMVELGTATGHEPEAERVAEQTRERIEREIASVPRPDPPLEVLHELGPDLYAASSDTFIGRIYARMGLRNIADRAARSTGSPYPQLSPEAVVAANPDLVVLADTECCGQTVETVERRSGWDAIEAVRNGGVVPVDDDIASRWGPRLPQFVARIAQAVRELG